MYLEALVESHVGKRNELLNRRESLSTKGLVDWSSSYLFSSGKRNELLWIL